VPDGGMEEKLASILKGHTKAGRQLCRIELAIRFFMINRVFTRRLGVLALVVFVSISAKARDKDTVVMKNGDRLTGEVKKLENGVFYLDTRYFADTTSGDWIEVETIKTAVKFQVVLKNGQRGVGTLEKVSASQAPGQDFIIHPDGSDIRADSQDVVNIESEKPTFWRQLKGSIDAGYNFTSGNNQGSFSSDGSASYETTKWLAGASYTSAISGQSDAAKTNTMELQTLDELFLSRNSYLGAIGDFLHSSEQDLALRTTLGGGYVRYLVRTNHNTLAWLTGIVYSHEHFFTSVGQAPTGNAEGLLGGQYQLFRFTRYILQSQLMLYPGLSDAGRVRLTTKTSFTVKLKNNFSSNFSFWDNFDSRPPFDSKGNELGISTGLGWSF
jgi:hypothetical protein